jgi:hypothetical protein
MEQLKALSMARKLVLGGGVLLLIDTFFAWQSITVSGFGTASWTAWHGFWGVLLGLMTIALVAWVLARTFGVEMPAGIPEGLISLVLGILIFAFALLKNLIDDYSAWASYVGIVLAAIVAYGAWLNFQESGESLPSMPRTATAGAPAAAGTTSSAPAPPVDVTPPPEAEPSAPPPDSDSPSTA